MRRSVVLGLKGAGLAALLLSSASQAGQPAPSQRHTELDSVKQQLAEQRQLIEALRRDLAEQRAQLGEQRAQSGGQRAQPGGQRAQLAGQQALSADELALRRGTGNPAGGGDAGRTPVAPDARRPVEAPVAQTAVGRPPAASPRRPPAVAPLFEQPGILTPKGKFILEPSMQFGYSSSNRVALVGYTVIPALLIGLLDVREVKRNSLTAALSARAGLSNRFELEARVPYVYRSDSTVSREVFTGTSEERVFDTSGKHLGDVELAARYQLNQGGADSSYFVGGLRFKSRTGRDPFSVVTDCTKRCIGENVTGTGLPLELPTGSGFTSLQPSLTWLFPTDPAVLFGSISYLHNFKRENVSRTVLGGEREFIGTVKPGAILGFNFGIGLALNEKTSLSLGYDHSSIGRTRQGGVPVPGAVRTQLGTLLMGFSYRLSEKRTVNVSVGAGLTRDTPDVSLSIRVPATF